MWSALSRLASSMKGLFSVSDRVFHSVPSRLDISELCILGFSWAIFRRWPLDQTMKAFIGLLMWFSLVPPGLLLLFNTDMYLGFNDFL